MRQWDGRQEGVNSGGWKLSLLPMDVRKFQCVHQCGHYAAAGACCDKQFQSELQSMMVIGKHLSGRAAFRSSIIEGSSLFGFPPSPSPFISPSFPHFLSPSLPFPLYPSLLPSIPPSCPHFFPPSLISFLLVSFLFSLSTGDSVLDSTKRLTHELYLQTQKGSFNFKNVSLNFPSLISWGSSFLYIPKTWTPGSDSLYNTKILYTRHYVQCFVFNTQKIARKSLLCLLGKLKVQRR